MSSTGSEDQHGTVPVPPGTGADRPEPSGSREDAGSPGPDQPEQVDPPVPGQAGHQDTSQEDTGHEETAVLPGDEPTSSERTAGERTSGERSGAAEPAVDRTARDAADQTETTALPRTGAASGERSERSTGPSFQPAGGAASGEGQSEATTVMHRPGEPDPFASTGSGRSATSGTPGAPTEPERDPAAERAAARAERQRALGVRSQPTPQEEPVEVGPTKHNTDRFLGSLGLFLLRLVVAAIMGIHGVQKFLMIGAGDTSGFDGTALPYPDAFFVATAIGEVLIALALVLGLLVRVAGLGVLAVAVGALVLVYWYQWPFEAGTSGFAGELELLLAGVGLLLACVGGGWWGIDAAMRRGRARRRADV